MPKYRRGSGSVYTKRGWCYIGYYVAGKLVCEAAKTKDKAEARRLLQARLGQLAEGRYVGPAVERVTFDDLARALLTEYTVNDRKSLRAVRIVAQPYIPLLSEDNARQGFFERAEFEAVLATLPDALRPPLTFAYYTGWRLASEILRLTWDRADLEEDTVRLYRGTTKNADGLCNPPPGRAARDPRAAVGRSRALFRYLPLRLP